MPPHEGHRYLIEFAHSFCPDLTVVVGSLESEPIPGGLRVQWMRDLFPNVRLVHLTDENPQFPHQHPHFWEIWKASLERVVEKPIDFLFASEEYGLKLAQTLDAQFIPACGLREQVPISATEIRNDPVSHWELIPRLVRPYFCKKVLLFGPESCGKTTLAGQLADAFGGEVVPEYARTWLREPEPDFDLTDMELIARGQWAAEHALIQRGKPYLFCDTDPLTTALWCQELFGEVPESVERLCHAGSYHLVLLLKPDLPWESGHLRLRPDTRERFFKRCREELEKRGRNYQVIEGKGEERSERAAELVRALRFGIP